MFGRLKQKFGLGFVLLIVAAGLYILFHFLFLDFVVDSWWFESLGYRTYFWQRFLYRYAILATFTALFFAIFFFNFWLASRFLKNPEGRASTESQRKIARFISSFRRGSMKVYTPLSIILAVISSYPLYKNWETTLLFIFSSKSGISDPWFGKDISFFLFALPTFRLIQNRLFLSFAILMITTALLYGIEIGMLKKSSGSFKIPKIVRVHLSFLVVLLFTLIVVNFLLERYELVYSHTHKAFFGPGFTEMHVTLPLIWLNIILITATMISLIVFLNTGRGWPIVAGITIIFLLSYGARTSQFISSRVQKYIVKPNEISRESRYIARSIKATLDAYNLSNVKMMEYRPASRRILRVSQELEDITRNVPVWDKELLHDVFKQLQGIRPYYDFLDVDVDRYNINGLYQQVFVGARELAFNLLPENARNWVNLHMKYTHGHGAVMTPAVQGGEEPITWFLKDIPPKSEYGIKIGNPSIYFGQTKYPYAIVPNDLGEMGYPKGEKVISENYNGKSGVPISSLFRKVLFALYFKDRNIFFTTKTNDKSKIIFRRNIIERITKIAPFLLLDRDPYAVITSKGIFWIQDAYTTSRFYPGAEPFNGSINYIRSSVKIVIDAYNGTVSFYISDPDDPIIKAYSRAYPGLFKDISSMDKEIRKHLRYPKDLFEIQMKIFARYHQKNPETFYKQEDAWRFARIFKGSVEKIITPYYLTLNLLDPHKFEFLLIQPFSPRGLDTLRAIAAVSCDEPKYGKIVVLTFPKDIQVYGPSQINALIDQDTYVSQQFTLWNQIGSEVERGKMIILPYGGSVLYIQPVYLKAATTLKIPELKRLIVAYEDMVVMDATLEMAIHKLSEKLKIRDEMYRRRMEKFSGKASDAKPTGSKKPESEKVK